jgi:hypothetical protein
MHYKNAFGFYSFAKYGNTRAREKGGSQKYK